MAEQTDVQSTQDTTMPDHDHDQVANFTILSDSTIPETERPVYSKPAPQTKEHEPSGETSSKVDASKLTSQLATSNSSSNLPHQQQQQQQQPELTLEQKLTKAKRDLESMVLRYAKSESENLQNKAKSDELERKLKRAIKDNDSLANRIKILTNDKNSLKDTLNAKVAQLTVLEQKNCLLTNTQSVKLKELESEVEQLRKTNQDLLKSIETYKSKEGELLDFSERLSMKQMLLQAELDKALESAPHSTKQCEQLVKEKGDLNECLRELQEKCALCVQDLEAEKKLNETLREEKLEMELKCRRKLEELENEMKVMRRKHQIALKELLKQVRCLQVAMDKTNTQNGNKSMI